MKSIALFLFFLINIIACAFAVDFTAAEKDYINKHQTIKASNELDYPPFDYAIGSEPQGYSISLLNLLAEKIGIKIEYINGYTWKQLLSMFQDGKIDLMHTASKTPERERYALFSNSYYENKNYIFSNIQNRKINNIQELYGKTIAVGKGWAQEEYLALQHPKIKLLAVDSIAQIVRAVHLKCADAGLASIGAVKHHINANANTINDIRFDFWLSDYDTTQNRYFRFMAKKDSPLLISILNKALNSLTNEEKDRLEARWLADIKTVDNSINLSAKEREFIKTHPVIKLESGATFEPLVINDGGIVGGHDKELLDMISEKTGLRFELRTKNWQIVQERAKERKIDGFTSAGYVKERENYLNPSDPYLKFQTFVVSKKGNPKDLHSIDDLEGKKVAIQKGNHLFERLIKETKKDIEIIYYENIHQVIKAVASAEVDFTVLDESVYYVANRIGLVHMIETPFTIGKPFSLMFWFRNDWPELASIVNKAMSSIEFKEKHRLRNRWFGHDIEVGERITLTTEERAYLQSRENITMCIDPSWMPFEAFDEKGEYVGMSADYYRLFEIMLKTTFEVKTTATWSESLEYAQARKCDLLSLAMQTPERNKYMNFTTPYFKIPLVVTTKMEVPFINDIMELEGKKIGIPKGYAFVEILKKNYPTLTIVEVKNIDTGLDALNAGKLDAYIGTLASVGYRFQTKYFGELKIAGKLSSNLELSIGVRKDDATLLEIMQKVVNNITQEQHRKILNKWVSVKYEKGTDYTLVWRVVALALLIIAIFIYWNRRIAKTKKETEVANALLEVAQKEINKKNQELQKLAVTDKLTGLYNRTKLDELLQNEINRSKRFGHSFGLSILDIDHFKSVNDTYGHPVGDKVLIDMAKLLKNNIRTTDLTGRWGGEEFVVICPETDKEGVMSIVEKIRIEIEKHQFPVVKKKTASFGVSIFQSGDSAEALLKRADDALYKAKESGRNRTVLV